MSEKNIRISVSESEHAAIVQHAQTLKMTIADLIRLGLARVGVKVDTPPRGRPRNGAK